MTWVGTLTAVMPLFAPAIGGKLDVLYGWHANLYCIALFSAILSFIMLFSSRQKTSKPMNSLSFKDRINIYGHMLKNKTFISYIALFGLLNCGEWCFLTMAPFYYAHKSISPDHMGLLLMITSAGFVFGSLFASYLFKRLGVDKTINIAIQLALISSLILLGGEYLQWNYYPLFNAIILGIYILSSALLWGGTTSRALQCFDDYRGSASAVRSLILLCFAALGTFSGRLVSHEHIYHVGFFLFFMALCALIVFHNKELTAERLAEDVAF